MLCVRNEAAITMAPLPLEQITAPSLVITAKDDLYNTLPAAEHLAERLLGAGLVVLDSGGHLMIGHWAEVDRATADFLEGVETEENVSGRSQGLMVRSLSTERRAAGRVLSPAGRMHPGFTPAAPSRNARSARHRH